MMTHNSRIGGAIFVSIADCLAELLQPLPQVARFGDAEVDTLLVVKLYLKPQLVLPKTCTHTHTHNRISDALPIKKTIVYMEG